VEVAVEVEVAAAVGSVAPRVWKQPREPTWCG